MAQKLLDELPPNYYQIIFKYLFTLHPDLQEKVDEFKIQHFGGYNVGIQIRHPTISPIKGEKDHKGFPVPPLDIYAHAAEQLCRFQEKVPYEDTKFFVATQNVDLIHKLQQSYGDRIIWYNGTITTTFDSHPEGQKVSLVTWWIMGECDEVVSTEASSYGTTAAARAGKYPVVCTHHKFCFRRLSQTPCQDTQFLPDQPMECLKNFTDRKPHQLFTSPENSCGYFKWQIYTSPEFQSDNWNIKQ